MAYQRKAPPSKCKVVIHFGQDRVVLDILPTTLIASVKDLALSQLSNALEPEASYSLTLLNGKLLSVEFIRLQSADESISANIKNQNPIELRLVASKKGITRDEKSLGLSSSYSTSSITSSSVTSSKSVTGTSYAASTIMPSGRPRIASKIGKLSAVFLNTTPSPKKQTQSLKVNRYAGLVQAQQAATSVKMPFSDIPADFDVDYKT